VISFARVMTDHCQINVELERFFERCKLSREEYLADYSPDFGHDVQAEWEEMAYDGWETFGPAMDTFVNGLSLGGGITRDIDELDTLIVICCIDWCSGSTLDRFIEIANDEARSQFVTRALEMQAYRTKVFVYENPSLYFGIEPMIRSVMDHIRMESWGRLACHGLKWLSLWDHELAKELASAMLRHPDTEVRKLCASILTSEAHEGLPNFVQQLSQKVLKR
jgi:hypothetical protein